ncbi:hypothetical protein CC78DRAFT_603788 [Lojkania enalia]|uniref:Uncharacterized protein n=1 Tax=Lojkania enalia TaxID=147567 RepID=A0A9P4KCI3_9PLEO|nr:hypothetical protein CC78DRAFT_603788 [Didymosphaeria enalia]
MPLTDRDANGSGRTSRASNLSVGSRGMQKGSGPGGRSDLLANVGVMSMLRTGTEIGDVEALTYDTSNMMPRGLPRRGGASSRPSSASSLSNASRRTSNHQAWPSASSGARRSLKSRESNIPQYVADTLSPTIVNFPGSSPLIPRSRASRDGNGRSFSMTHSSQPAFALSSNRSYSSLGAHDHLPRPRSPYRYPVKLRRPGYRSVSPALSDITGTQYRRSYGNPGQIRLKTPPEMAAHHNERVQLGGYSGRNALPTLPGASHVDARPVPPRPHTAVGQTRVVHRSAKGSTSSGSSNRRTDSDVPSAPSSDDPSPPTPQGGASMEVLVHTATRNILSDGMAADMKGSETIGPLYYDYSEQFERDQYVLPTPEAVPTGIVRHIKTQLEERVTAEQVPKKIDDSVVQEIAELPGSEVVSVAELPASPVPQRITRDLVRAALRPASMTGDISVSVSSTEGKEASASATKLAQGTDVGLAKEQISKELISAQENDGNRQSVLSHPSPSIVDSSTVEVALRYSSPIASGTEDGMSDLLDGYQHTETKQGLDTARNDIAHDVAEKTSSHTPQSSDQQSFKSCTDLGEQPCKDTDAKSFKTCKDTVTPERSASLPASRLPSMNAIATDVEVKRPISEIPPPPSPSKLIRKQLPVPPGKSSFSKSQSLACVHRTRSRQGSTVTSISSSIENSTKKAPPPVPPRASSTSREAQHSQAAQNFLLRLTGARRFSKNRSSLKKKSAKREPAQSSGSSDHVPKFIELPQVSITKGPSLGKTSAARESSVRRKTRLEMQSDSPIPAVGNAGEKASTSSTPLNSRVSHIGPTTPIAKFEGGERGPLAQLPINCSGHSAHQHSFSTPVVPLLEPSSLYSVEDPTKASRVQSSPVALPQFTDNHRCESQSTTDLVWQGHKSVHLLPVKPLDPQSCRNSGQDDSTTDLRLSTYNKYSPHHLPDVKEESHEDSSLNTSASNLKNSSFRFPVSGLSPVRASIDEPAFHVRAPSAQSIHKSSLAKSRGLPSMNFSNMDLAKMLSEALGIRVRSRSFDTGLMDIQVPSHTSPPRPSTAGEYREKYRSVFAGLDAPDKVCNAVQTTTIMDIVSANRPCTPSDLLAEIDKLTIPSVGGLTQRLSEWVPSLRQEFRFEEDSEPDLDDEIIEHALEELSEVGPTSKRSSARLRPMPGSPHLVIVDDDLYQELTGKEKEGAGAGAGVDGEVTQEIATEPGATKAGDVNRVQLGTHVVAELETPSFSVLRARSLSAGHHDLRPSLESRLSSKRSLRSLRSTPTPTDTRPWNSDKNYPWATIPSIDISLPGPTTLRGSPRPGPSPLRGRVSESPDANTPAPIGSLASPKTPLYKPIMDGSPAHTRRQSRLSFFTYNKRLGLPTTPCFDTNGFPTGPIHVSGGDQTHEAGERYPTSALKPPVDTNFSRSRWSDDTSEDESHLVMPRKSKLKNSLKARFVMANRSQVALAEANPTENNTLPTRDTQDDPLEDGNEYVGDLSSRRRTFSNAKGMSNSTFQGRRLIEKLRKWWHRSSEMLRNISGRRPRTKSPKSNWPRDVEETVIVDSDGHRIVPLRGTRGVALWTGV